MRILIGIVIGIVVAEVGINSIFYAVGNFLQFFVDMVKSIV